MAKEELFSDPNNEHSSGSSSHNNDKNNPLLGTEEPESIDDFSFKILHEEVGDTDAFDNGTHKRISETLFNLVTTQEKAATIGLEGEWGSGKSTVINLLRKRLEEASDTEKEPDNTPSESNPVIGKTLFFNFDTWSHEGDTLRKSFLEELCDAASESLMAGEAFLDGCIEENANKKVKASLEEARAREFCQLGQEATGRRVKTTITTNKSLPFRSRVILGSSLLVPVGLQLFRGVDFNNLCFEGCSDASSINGFFIFGLLFSLLPLILWGAFFLRNLCENRGKQEQEKQQFQLFNLNHKETATQQVSDGKDRTSLEFKQYFHRILKLALEGREIGNGQEKDGEDKNKSKGLKKGAAKLKFERVIIIIDNLDRIESDHAKAVWQTLQTFFEHRSSSNKRYKNIIDKTWFIVPYDRSGLEKVWGSSSYPVSLKTMTEREKLENAGLDTEKVSLQVGSLPFKKSEAVKSFVEKNFQLVIEVPQLVMTDWEKYLKAQVSEALSTWKEDERNKLIENFHIYFDAFNTELTPRQIKRLINRIGLLRLQRSILKNDISIESYVSYAINRDGKTVQEYKDMLSFEHGDVIYRTQKLVPNIDELSALLFNVKVEVSIQVFIKELLNDVLDNGIDNIELFKVLVENYRCKFIAQWEGKYNKVLIGSLSKKTDKLSNLLRLYESSLYNLVEEEAIKNVLEDVIENISDWQVGEENYARPIALINKVVSKLDKSKKSMKEKVVGVLKSRLPADIKMLFDTSNGKDKISVNVQAFFKEAKVFLEGMEPLKEHGLGEEYWIRWNYYCEHELKIVNKITIEGDYIYKVFNSLNIDLSPLISDAFDNPILAAQFKDNFFLNPNYSEGGFLFKPNYSKVNKSVLSDMLGILINYKFDKGDGSLWGLKYQFLKLFILLVSQRCFEREKDNFSQFKEDVFRRGIISNFIGKEGVSVYCLEALAYLALFQEKTLDLFPNELHARERTCLELWKGIHPEYSSAEKGAMREDGKYVELKEAMMSTIDGLNCWDQVYLLKSKTNFVDELIKAHESKAS